MTDDCEARLAQARAETRAAFANRALMYAYFYDEFAAEVGEERATELMKRAIRRRGVEIGRAYAEAADAGDLEQVARIFVESSPSEGALFEPGVEATAQGGEVVLHMTACPLADAWREAGYSPEAVERLCDIAAEVDYGTFEGAGLELEFLERQACVGGERCLLRLSVPAEGSER